jgi:N12 class adenine-specific DNA methylase
LADQAPKWLDTAEIKDPLGGENMVVNRYFQDNPGQIVGTMERSGSMRYKNDVTVRLDDVKELESRLNQLVEKLPKDIVSTADDVAANTENAY